MTPVADPHRRSIAIVANRLVYGLSRHWLLLFGLSWGVFIGLPWLAPVAMKLGWNGIGRAIYLFYATQCHQMPQRSFFLFGPKAMYSLAEIQAAWQPTTNPLILRQFMGNPAMGWKVAWSDRMVFMYGSLLLWGLLYWPLRHRLKPLRLWSFALLLLPMIMDGVTHAISDFAIGIGSGFRDTNTWLAVLTNHALPATFYVGDAPGSFNSWARLITGMLFGLGVVWLLYPYLESGFTDTAGRIEDKFRRAGLSL
ncbi:MAG: DUF2085 domain-containing protein [Chloroflexota bacterium]